MGAESKSGGSVLKTLPPFFFDGWRLSADGCQHNCIPSPYSAPTLPRQPCPHSLRLPLPPHSSAHIHSSCSRRALTPCDERVAVNLLAWIQRLFGQPAMHSNEALRRCDGLG